jgi:hypothetical protein
MAVLTVTTRGQVTFRKDVLQTPRYSAGREDRAAKGSGRTGDTQGGTADREN